MTGFVQIIEYRTSRWDEIEAFLEEWRQRSPEMGPSRVTVCRKHDEPTSFTSIIEFPSYEDARRNDAEASTQEFAAFMQSVCDGPPTFHDLDVLRTEIRTDAGASRSARV